MARAIWTGSVSFGLVNVPVGLFSATQDHQVHFTQDELEVRRPWVLNLGCLTSQNGR